MHPKVFIASYSRVADVKRYEDKTALTSADLLNDRVLPWYQEPGVPLLRILTDRSSEYKGKLENHAYALFLSVEGMTAYHDESVFPAAHRLCERFHKTMKQAFFATAMRQKIDQRVSALPIDLDSRPLTSIQYGVLHLKWLSLARKTHV